EAGKALEHASARRVCARDRMCPTQQWLKKPRLLGGRVKTHSPEDGDFEARRVQILGELRARAEIFSVWLLDKRPEPQFLVMTQPPRRAEHVVDEVPEAQEPSGRRHQQ